MTEAGAPQGANLTLKFALELAAFASLAYWGSTAGQGAVAILLAVAAPALAIALWGSFAAPKARRRLPAATRIPFELGVFVLAALALFAAGHPDAAAVFGALIVVNAALLTAFDQWSE